MLAAALAGVPVRSVAPDRPRLLVDQLAAGGLVPMVPPMLRLLAQATAKPLTDVRLMTAGMPLDRRTAELVDTVLHARLGQVYGTTETGPICVTPPADPQATFRSLGSPLPGVSVDISCDQTETGAGLVSVTSPMAMLGYADGHDLDSGPLAGTGFRTGDLGRLTQDGLVLVGRVSNCINVAGAKVSPEEIEAVVLEFPGVHSCLVHGLADDRLGERVQALVTPSDVDLRALERFCAERLSPPHLPSLFKAVPALETTETGKTIRPRANVHRSQKDGPQPCA